MKEGTNKSKIIFITALVCIALCIPIGIILGRTLLGKNESNKTNNNVVNNTNENISNNTEDEIEINGVSYIRSEVVYDISVIDKKLNGFSLEDLNNVDVYGDEDWNNDSENLNRYDLLLGMSISNENYVKNLVKFVLLKMNVAKGELNKKYMNFKVSTNEFSNILNRFSKKNITENDLIGLTIENGNSIKCDAKECNIYNPFSVPTILLHSGNIILSKKLEDLTLKLGYVYFLGEDNFCKYYSDFSQTKLLKEINTNIDLTGSYKYCQDNYNSNEYTSVTFNFESNNLGGYRLLSIK